MSTTVASARRPKKRYLVSTKAVIVPKKALMTATSAAISMVRISACRAPSCEKASLSDAIPPPKPFVTTAESGRTTIRPR